MPVEYCKEYKNILAAVLLKVYLEIFDKGKLPQTFNEKLISLIPKKDRDISDPNNYRSISLFNVDYKKIISLKY